MKVITLLKKDRSNMSLPKSNLRYMSINLGLPKMIEIGCREMPTAALLKLNKLALHNLPAPFAPAPAK